MRKLMLVIGSSYKESITSRARKTHILVVFDPVLRDAFRGIPPETPALNDNILSTHTTGNNSLRKE